MKYLWIFSAILLIGSVPAWAGKVEKESKDSIYFTKYGQKGLDQYNHFVDILNQSYKPVSTKTVDYKAVLPKIELDMFKPKYVEMAVPDNSQCIQDDVMSTERSTTTEKYDITYDGKKHEVLVVRNICSGALYDIKNKTLRAEYDCDSYSSLQIYKDGKKLFDVNEAGKYAIYKNEIVVNLDNQCGNMGSAFSYYDWANNKVLGENILQTSLDDVPSVDLKLEDIVLPNGEKLVDFEEKNDKEWYEKFKKDEQKYRAKPELESSK